MVKNQSGYVESLGQRCWTTDGKTFVTEQDLDALVERLSNKQGVRVKEQPSEDIVFRYMGFLTNKRSKEGVPVFVDQNMNGYLGLPVEGIKPGELYTGIVENITSETRNLGLIAKIAGNREMRIDGGGPPKIVRYNVKSKTNLEEALKFGQTEDGKYNVPVYRGPILEFVKEWGPIKKSKPLKVKVNGGSEIKIVGGVVIDKDKDYRPLSDFCLNNFNKRTLSSLDNYVISQYPQGYWVLVEKGRLNNVILGDYPEEMIQGIPINRGYLDYLTLLPFPSRVDDIPASIMNSISSNLDSIQTEIKSRDYQPKPVSREVTSMKQLFIDSKPSEYYVAMAKTRTGKKELYLTREPFNGLHIVDIDGKGIVKETSLTKDNLEMGENGALILWRNSRLVIEGNFRKAQGFSYNNPPLVGLLV